MTLPRPRAATGRQLSGAAAIAGLFVQGYVCDIACEGEALVVELFADGVPHGLARADLHDASLAAQGHADPFHGFLFALPQAVVERAATLEVRLANEGTLIGGPLVPIRDNQRLASVLGHGEVRWLGGLRFGGWLAPDTSADTPVRGLIDENKVVETLPRGWVTVDRGGVELAVRAFEFDLPPRFADARAHRITVIAGETGTLAPSPLVFVAFEDGLASFLARQSDVAAEQVRGERYDQLMPQSLPFAALGDWRRRFELTPPTATDHAVAVVLIGEDDIDASLESLREQGETWIAGVMSPRAGSHEFDSADLVAFLDGEADTCAAVIFAQSGTVFTPGALQRLAEPIQDDPETDCVYADTIMDLGQGRRLPLAHGAFDRERMIEQGYATALFALRRSVVHAAASAGAGSLPRLFLAGSGIENEAQHAPLHLPGFMATLPPIQVGPATHALLDAGRRLCANLDMQARIEPVSAARLLPAIRLMRRPLPCLVSVVVRARNEPAALRHCLDALRAQETVHEMEIIVVDNDSADGEMGALIAQAASEGIRVLSMGGPANIARAINLGAAAAGGSYILFLDQHVALAAHDALDEMVSRCSSHATGAVGGVLTWPSGAVYDGGRVLTMHDGSKAAFRGLAAADPGYAETLLVAHEASAVSSAMMMVARDTFNALGGMDEVIFPLFFAAEAYCLAGAAHGHRTVVTPYARAVWSGPADGGARDGEARARFERELASLRNLWPEALANDPCYSPLLNLDGEPHMALAWPPRGRSVRRPRSGGATTPSETPVSAASDRPGTAIPVDRRQV